MLEPASVHSILPESLTRAAGAVLEAAGIGHVAHGTADIVGLRARQPPIRSAGAARPDRSADVAEAVEVTGPTGLALLSPVATWAGVTRDDEPGCDDAARHCGTVLRLVARDTEVAARIATDVRAAGQHALVVAGEHDYGRQLDGQLRLASLPRAERADDADLVVLAGLAGEPEIERAAATAPLPLVAFDGAQGAALGDREVHVALPVRAGGRRPDRGAPGRGGARGAAADLVVRAIAEDVDGRPAVLTALRRLGGFDANGDPSDPPVWLWRADSAWELRAGPPVLGANALVGAHTAAALSPGDARSEYD